MEREQDTPASDEDTGGGSAQDVNELLDQWGTATESKGMTWDEIERRIEERGDESRR